MTASSDNKRIAKNTLFLFLRMLLLTAINLFAVRITINILGATDYGIYNVVASVVALFALISGILVSATQRYLSFELGKENIEGFTRMFNMFLMTFFFLSMILVAAGAVVAPFLFDNVLKIPFDRIPAAKWVYFTSLGVYVVYMLTIPFTAALVAYEKMTAYAYLGLIDGVLKLGIIYTMLLSISNRLQIYGTVVLLEVFVMLIVYAVYALNKLPGCRFSFHWDNKLFRELTTFIGWNFIGALTGVGNNQGQNIMLNYFFGPTINATKTIGDKLYSLVSQLGSNLYMAVTPQLVKSYASSQKDRMLSLGIVTSKFSFLLILIFVFPLICAIKELLSLWLGEESRIEYLTGFAVLSLSYSLVATLENPISNMIRASGNLKYYQLIVGAVTISYLPICAIALYSGASPLSTMVILIAVMLVAQFVRVWIANRQLGLSIRAYNRTVCMPICIISVICVVTWMLISKIQFSNLIVQGAARGVVAFFSAMAMIWFVGLNKSEKGLVKRLITNKLIKRY